MYHISLLQISFLFYDKRTRKILVVETFFDCHRRLDRAVGVKKFIDDFNNSAYFWIKVYKKSCRNFH